jgi:hypothetical protein
MPRNLDPIYFDDCGFPGFIALAWTSAPLSLTDGLVKIETEAQGRELLLELIPDWNFVTAKGEPIPHTPEGFDLMPQVLVTQMMTRYKMLTLGVDPAKTGEVAKKLSDPFVLQSIDGSNTDKPTTPNPSPSST